MESRIVFPLKISYSDGSGGEYITDAKNDAVCVVRWGCDCCKASGPLTEVEAKRAAFIVRACNAHDALVEVCEAAAAYWQYSEAPIGERARAALALAKGEA